MTIPVWIAVVIVIAGLWVLIDIFCAIRLGKWMCDLERRFGLMENYMEDEPGHKSICDWVNDRLDALTIKDTPCLDQVVTRGDGSEQDDIDKASNVLRAMWHHADAWQREAIIIILKELAQ
jgi:hypothetical protein